MRIGKKLRTPGAAGSWTAIWKMNCDFTWR